jgi:hypothetical protein
MVPVVIDPETGGLASEWCPRREIDWFKPGTEPQEQCLVHTGWPTQVAGDVTADGTPVPGARRNNPMDAIGRELKRALGRIFRF